MRVFKDNGGRTWNVSVNIGTVKRIKTLAGVDLLQDSGLVERLASDYVLLCDILYVVCKPQADQDGVSDEQFAEAIHGDVIEAAADAFVQELVDFFPQAKRTVLSKAMTKIKAAENRMAQIASDRLDQVDVEDLVREATSGLQSMSEQGSAGSTQTH